PFTTYGKALRARKFVADLIEKQGTQREQKKQEEKFGSVVHHLIKNNQNADEEIPLSKIIDEGITVLFAAQDTTSTSLFNTLMYIAYNSDIQQKLYEEQIRVAKHRVDRSVSTSVDQGQNIEGEAVARQEYAKAFIELEEMNDSMPLLSA